jgi:DNA-binding transcriptional LysR family regulator
MNPPPLPLRTLDLNLLKVFDVVMVERSVTRAAARLSMTQPAVSNALRRLRDATRQELFSPHASGVTPTTAAQVLWPVVRESLQRLQGALEAQVFDAQAQGHSFSVAMADATAALFVPVLLQALQRERSCVDLCFVPLSTRDPRPMLEQGEADAAVGFFPEASAALAAEGQASTLRRQALYGCEYVCVMRRSHPLARPGALTLDAYCAAQHLRVSFAGRPRGFVDEEMARLGRERRVIITVNQYFTAGAVVQGSDLLTVLPLSFVPATGFQSKLAIRPLPFALPQIDVSLLWHGRHDASPAHRWLREALVQAAAQVAETAGITGHAAMGAPDGVRPPGPQQITS